MFKTERDEIRVRTAIKNIIESQALHPDLAGIEGGLREDLKLLNNVGIAVITEQVYKLILLELNDNTNK